MTDIEYIRQALSPADVWGQLAEEAAELAQAALKMQRLEQGTNPPRKAPKECLDNVYEELGDIQNCLTVLDFCFARGVDEEYRKARMAKLERWAAHLKEKGRICGSCEWHDEFSWVCCNGDSEYAGEFTNDSFTCDEWEKEEIE